VAGQALSELVSPYSGIAHGDPQHMESILPVGAKKLLCFLCFWGYYLGRR
jgi:hypothetical protein